MDTLGTAELHQSQEYRDVTIRIQTSRGSIPVIVVSEGILLTANEIGVQVRQAFNYHVQSDVFEAAKERNHEHCENVGICTCPR